MADSKAVSIRIPDELLAKIDALAERKYKSIKGKPNRSLVILDALVAHFDKLPDTENSNSIATPNDTVSIDDFRDLQKSFLALSDTVEKLARSLSHLEESLAPPGLSAKELAERLGISISTLSHWKNEKTPEDFLKSTRKKDPENIGWEVIPSINRFQPERQLTETAQLNLKPLASSSDS